MKHSVGAQIRVARQHAALSLEQVSASTCIPVKILQAIENDDLTPITSVFFYKSFVRQFAGRIGLPYENLAAAVESTCGQLPEQLKPGQGEAIIRNSMVHLARKPRYLRWLYPAGSLAAVLIACSGFYAYWEGHFGHVSSISAGVQTLQRSAMPSHNEVAPAKDAHLTEPVPARPSLSESPEEADGRFHVQLSALERTWLSIQTDGKMVYSGILEIDQTKVIEGREKGQLRTGNAGGVSIVFNGKPIGVAGPHGSVRTVVFTRDNYQVLPAATEHAKLELISNPIAEWLLPRLMR
jgi:cytoskeletal protein RodZ